MRDPATTEIITVAHTATANATAPAGVSAEQYLSREGRLVRTSGIATAAALAVFIGIAGVPDTTRAIDPSTRGEIHVRGQRVLPPHLWNQWAEMAAYRTFADDWDGEGSKGPSFGAIDAALDFLSALPETARPPEATISADGTVGWFWRSPDAFISVAFHGGREFAYYGEARAMAHPVRDTGVFDGQSIPASLLDAIALA